MVFCWALTENCSASFIHSHLFFSDTHRVLHSSLRTFEQSIKEKTGLDSSPHCSEMHNIGLILSSAPGLVLAIGRAGDCLGPRALRRASITVASLYASPPVQSGRNTSLFIHWIWLNCHSSAIKPINVAVSMRVPPSGCLRNERILQVLRTIFEVKG